MLELTKGFRFWYNVKQPATLVIKAAGFKFVKQSVDDIILITPQESEQFPRGIFKYQILGQTGVIEEGQIKICPNYLLEEEETDVKSENEQILEAIEAQLAGRATSGQSSMSVGDKSIGYMSISELLQLRDYFKEKVDKEQNKPNQANGGTIKYKWSLR